MYQITAVNLNNEQILMKSNIEIMEYGDSTLNKETH